MSIAVAKRPEKVDETQEVSRMVRSSQTRAGDIFFVVVCVLIGIICLVPMINLLARSLSASDALVKHEVYLWPKGLNFDAYTTVLSDIKYIKSFGWTVILTFM